MTTDRSDNLSLIWNTDQAGTCFVEQSTDGKTADFIESFTTTAGANGNRQNTVLVAPYVRVRYVNGGTNQNSFRLAAKFGSAGDS
jgi:hypothetical protein